jgi:hypothetical protein
MITLKIQVDTNDNVHLLSQLLGNLNFINNVEISNNLGKKFLETSVPQKQKSNPKKFYGIWKYKNIKDVKKFRESLWERG